MHVIKAKRSLEDYFDLNRRYMKTADVILFADGKVVLDIVPRHYFAPICDRLLDIAFDDSPLLQENCRLEDIAAFLRPNENVILDGINREFALKLQSLKDTGEILDRQRYIRLNHLIDSKFTDEKILSLLNLIAERSDDEIQKLVTDNADIPTIFEYVLGIICCPKLMRRAVKPILFTNIRNLPYILLIRFCLKRHWLTEPISGAWKWSLFPDISAITYSALTI